MAETGTPRPRTSPRQAIIVRPAWAGEPRCAGLAAALGPDRLDALLLAALLDVIGVLVRVDGAALTVVAPSRAAADALGDRLPAGIDLLAPQQEPPHPAALLVAALVDHLGRGFRRVVAVEGDVLGLTLGLVGTALSALASADLVIGPTVGGAPYLIGVRDEASLALLAAGEPAQLAARAGGAGLVVRRLARRTRLGDLPNAAALAAAVTPEANPRLAAVPRATEEAGEG